MKIAFIFGSISLGGRDIDFSNIETDSRGLTGSELACIQIAREMAKKNHDVSLFIAQLVNIESFDNVKLYSLDKISIIDDSFDAIYSFNEPDIFRQINSNALKLVNQQWNDFGYCQPGFEELVDVFTSPSAHHLEYIKNHTKTPEKWVIVNNGCEPSWYFDIFKIPGSVIWASSPDRGLHNLLQAWPKIKKEVPEANLKLFYNCNYDHFDRIGGKIAHRMQYIKYAVEKLTPLNVQQIGSVSRKQMAEEISKSMILGFSCDTVSYTEGFSVTTMEGCAGECLPIISSCDSLGSIYGEHVPTVNLPINIEEYANLVIRGLTDDIWRDKYIKKAKSLALQYTWKNSAEQLENIICNKKKLQISAGKERLKIAVVYGPYNYFDPINEQFDWDNVYDKKNGLTGSDYGCLRVAEELSKEHDVSFYTPYKGQPRKWNNIDIYDFFHKKAIDETFNACISWNHPQDLDELPDKIAKIASLQINDFCFFNGKNVDYIDLWVSPSQSHLNHISSLNHFTYKVDPKRWTIIPDGCDPDKFTHNEKVSGRVIWASSPDRGLHRLFSIWAQIKKQVPHAHLKVFYKLKPWLDCFLNKRDLNNNSLLKSHNRALFINEYIKNIQSNKFLDVEICDSISKTKMNKEMSQAEVLAFFCDTVQYTEGFSMTTMESCAAKACPIITPVDALESIYGGILPIASNEQDYIDLIIKALTDKEFRDSVNEKAYNFSLKYSWENIAKQYEQAIIETIYKKI